MTDEERKEKRERDKAAENAAIVIVPDAEWDTQNGGNIVISPLLAPERSRGVQWKPGQSGNPKGRPKKEIERAYVDAAIEALTPNELSQVIRGLCFHPTSWRAQEAGSKIVLGLAVGLPTQRIIHEDSAFSSILEAIRLHNQPAIEGGE